MCGPHIVSREGSNNLGFCFCRFKTLELQLQVGSWKQLVIDVLIVRILGNQWYSPLMVPESGM